MKILSRREAYQMEEGFESRSSKKFNKYVLDAYDMPDTVLGTRIWVLDKPDKAPAFIKLQQG